MVGVKQVKVGLNCLTQRNAKGYEKNKMVVIKPERSKEFLQEWNKNLVNEEFMESCRKTKELFKRHKKQL